MGKRVSAKFYPETKGVGRRSTRFNILFLIINIVFLLVNLWSFIESRKERTFNPVDQVIHDTIVATIQNEDTIPSESSDTIEIQLVEHVLEKHNITHVVEANQTLYSISQMYGVLVDSLKKANDLDSTMIYIGMKLEIPIKK